MVATFRAFDSNDSGALDPNEFLSFLEEQDIHQPSKVVLEALFSRTDLDGDGQIDLNEWLLYGARREKAVCQANPNPNPNPNPSPNLVAQPLGLHAPEGGQLGG